MRTPRGLERVVFAVSLAVLAFLLGFAVSARQWPPNDLLVRAWAQGEALLAREPAGVQPRVYRRAGARSLTERELPPALTLVSGNFEDLGWAPGAKLVDRSGRTVHSWSIEPEAMFGDSATRLGRRLAETTVNGTYLFPDGRLLLNVDYVGTALLDACGKVVWTLPLGTHHAVSRAADGTFWIPAVSRRQSADEFAGLEDPIYEDRILRVSPEGTVLESHSVLELLYENGLERYIGKAVRSDPDDVTHLNDVEPLPDSLADEYPAFEAGDLALSIRHLDMVLVFDPETGRVRWHETRPFRQQHDADFLGDGWIGVFDNNVDGTPRGTMLGGSRVVAVRPGTDSTRVLFSAPDSTPFYTPYVGQWQRLDGGGLLLTESFGGRVLEVDADGRLVWEWIASHYSDERTPEVLDAVRVDVDRDRVASWPCSRPDSSSPSR